MTPKGVRASAAILLLAALLLLPSRASGQGVGFFQRVNCANLTSAVAGSTVCWDTVTSQWKVYNGASYATITAVNIAALGAKDDNATDNTTVIQAALNSGQPVYIPPTTSSFNFATTLTLPQNGRLYGAGNLDAQVGVRSSKLKYTGSGSAITLNAGATSMQQWGAVIEGITLQGTAGSSVNGIVMTDVINVILRRNTVLNFSNGGAAVVGNGDVSGRGPSMVTIADNVFLANSSCVQMSQQTENVRITGNECAGGTAVGARLGALEFTGEVASLLIAGNDINTNATPSEIHFGGNVLGASIVGNYINSAGAGNAAVNGIKFDLGANTLGSVVIEGNELYHSVASATGRAIWFVGFAAGGGGAIVRGNYINGYGNAANSAIDPGGVAFAASDFSGNTIVNAGSAFGTFGGGSTGVFPPGVSGTAQAFHVLPNARYYAGQNAAANSAYRLIGVNASNIVQIDADGLGAQLNGGAGGLQIGAPTSGDKGNGTINASAYYVHGTAIASMPLTNASGTITNAPHLVQDTVTLTGGTAGVALAGAAAFTSSTSYTCVCANDSSVLACRVAQNGGNGFTLSSGVGTDTVRFICSGN